VSLAITVEPIGKFFGNETPYVLVRDEDAAYFSEEFKSREELEAFVTRLQCAANEAWPKK
jgi:hypothetical protein